MKTLSTILLLGCAVISTLGQGTILWDESVNGSLSHESSSATPLASLQIGTNSILGNVENIPSGGIWIAYEDFFVISVPINLSVSAIYFQANRPEIQTWFGDSSFANQLGYSPASTTGDLLTQWGTTQPHAGLYGMYVANHDAEPVPSIADYRLDFVIVPEPSTITFVLAGAAGLLSSRRWWQR